MANKVPSRDEIEKRLKKVLMDGLGVDEDEIKPTSSLVADLGAESIDVIDIVFRIEQEFGIKIPRGDLLPEWNTFKIEPEYVNQGFITVAGLKKIHEIYPFVDLRGISSESEIGRVYNRILRFEHLVCYMEKVLKNPPPEPQPQLVIDTSHK